MSSHNFDCVEILPVAEDLSNSVDLERLAREISPATSEHVLPSSDRGVFIPELSRKICSVNQLTSQELASLTDQQCFRIFSYMVNDPNPLGGRLDHCPSQRQSTEEESSLSDFPAACPFGANQEASSEAQNALAGTNRSAEPSRGGCTKVRAYKGRVRGRHAREESGDAVQGGEDAARPLSRFEVDRHPTKMKVREMDLIRELYQVPDYVEFWLPGPSDQPTRPPPPPPSCGRV